MIQILKVLIGSRAHGLNTPESDYDYRGVFVVPTADLLRLGGSPKQTSWVEGRELEETGRKQDDTAWEIAHFLHLATKCNPTILEVFAAPVIEATEEGEELRALFPYIWEPKAVAAAFVGYGLNQRKKMLEDKDARWNKYATAYLRTLIQAERLLAHGVLMIDFTKHEEYQTLMLFRNKMVTPGQVLDKCQEWEAKVQHMLKSGTTAQRQQQNLEPINAYLLKLRAKHFAHPNLEYLGDFYLDLDGPKRR